MDNVLQDLRSAVRSLRKTPWFTLAVALTLAIAIGANTLVFSVVNAVLLQPMAYADPSRLVMVMPADSKATPTISPPTLRDWREQVNTLTGIAAYQSGSVTLTGLTEPTSLAVYQVSANWFALLGVRAEVGRAFAPNEDQGVVPTVVMLSDAFWRSRFRADPRVIGRVIDLNGRPLVVIGVAPPTATFPSSPDVWIPRTFTADQMSEIGRGKHMLDGAIARVAPNATVDAARREFEAVTARIRQQHLLEEAGLRSTLRPLRDGVVGQSRPALFILMGAVGCVLLIACANVANLQLVRASGRSAELGVRIALGAGRLRIARQLMTESLVLAVIGALGGVVLAYGGAHLLVAAHPGDLPRLDEVKISVTVLAFTGVVAVMTGLSFGLLPAMQAANHDIVDGLKSGMRGASASRRSGRLRDTLVVAETALAVLLLIGAGLLTRSVASMMAVDLGFVPQHVVRFSAQLPTARYTSWSQKRGFTHSVISDMQSLPGTSAAAVAYGAPFDNDAGAYFQIGGRAPDPPGRPSNARIRMVSPGYFAALSIPVRRGRSFTDDDRPGGHPVIVINDALARQFFAHENPIGQRIDLHWTDDSASNSADTVALGGEIVGVVGDTKEYDVTAADRPAVYLPFDQASPQIYLTFVVRSSSNPAAVIAGARQAVARADPLVSIIGAETYAAAIGDSIARPRLYATVVGAFAVSALMLAIIGIYGVLAYAVRERRRELGIRIALGANGRQVVGMVVGQGVRLAGAGALVGVAIALVLGGRVLASLLYNVQADDLATYGAVCVALLFVAALASWVPARRAAVIDPIIAMRPE
jgi:putative ABC transport system permease protein